MQNTSILPYLLILPHPEEKAKIDCVLLKPNHPFLLDTSHEYQSVFSSQAVAFKVQ